MAIPIQQYVAITDGINVQAVGASGSAVTAADGADVTEGAIADAAVTAGATGTVSAKLRSISRDIALLVQQAATVATTATVGSVASSATNVTLQASNAARKGWSVFNESTAVLYVKYGATASVTSYTVQVAPGGYFELSQQNALYTGIIDGIWASANGNARVTEW